VKSASSVSHVPAFTVPNAEFCHYTSNVKYNSSPIQCFKLFFTEFVVTLLVEESHS
jgi:hypothetical protein